MLGKQLQTAAAGAAGAAAGLGIEDVFSTYLYTGNGSTQTITNGIDLAGEGGMVWFKARTTTSIAAIIDTLRGGTSRLVPSFSNATNVGSYITSFNVDGFDAASSASTGSSGVDYASWTFRKAPGFFDVVTYTGNGSNRTIAHNLGSTPGWIVIKGTSGTSRPWITYHRSLGADKNIELQSTNAADTNTVIWNNTAPTSSVFSLGTNSNVNANGESFVAYLFAHDEQIFGEGGSESVIKCGSFTCTNTWGNFRVDLGWEPQFVLYKRTDNTSDWVMLDNMRGVVGPGDLALSDTSTFYSAVSASDDADLKANLGDSEQTQGRAGFFSQGFLGSTGGGGGEQYIYIAIRRGPMKTPTDATEVFNAVFQDGTAPNNEPGFVTDAAFRCYRPGGSGPHLAARLTGPKWIATSSTAAEAAQTNATWDYMTGWYENASASTDVITHNFRRAPGFFDVVAYTGTGSATTVSHNLGVVPDFVIYKRRDATPNWYVQSSGLASLTHAIELNNPDAAFGPATTLFPSSPTSTVLNIGTSSGINNAGATYIAYLFATVSGVSKVGSYTGSSSDVQVDCGFTAGARFVLIKRTDGIGDWCLFDTARGIVSGNDPLLRLNDTSAEDTGNDLIDPLSSGFTVVGGNTFVNGAGRSYIYLAIA